MFLILPTLCHKVYITMTSEKNEHFVPSDKWSVVELCAAIDKDTRIFFVCLKDGLTVYSKQIERSHLINLTSENI